MNQARAVKDVGGTAGDRTTSNSGSHLSPRTKEARPGDLRVVPADTAGLPADSIILIGKMLGSRRRCEANPDNLVFTAGDLLLTAGTAMATSRLRSQFAPTARRCLPRAPRKHQNFHVVGGAGLEALQTAPAIVIGEAMHHGRYAVPKPWLRNRCGV